MIGVTGLESTEAALADRIRSLPDVDLHEVRLDALAAPTPELVARLPARDRLLVTCRAAWEGGQFAGPEAERVALLVAALRAGARYVDLEAAAPDPSWSAVAAAAGPHRLVASLHASAAGDAWTAAGLAPLVDRLAGRPAGHLKLAIAVDDVADLGPLADVQDAARRPWIRIGMGWAGQVGRLAYRALGSAWTYVPAPGEAEVAPGQVDLARMQAIRDRRADRLLVLLGGEQIQHSPGPTVYERRAAALGLPYLYALAPTRRPEAALAVLLRLGLAGASVTMPFKERLRPLATTCDAAVTAVGAVNALRPTRDGGWDARCTDVDGVVGALRPRLGPGRAWQGLVLGAGGAARAAVVGLGRLGVPVTLTARDPDRAERTARHLGAGTVAWEDRAGCPFDVLVNATPRGADGEGSPLPPGLDHRDRVVLDLVLRGQGTPLLRDVAASGGVALSGHRHWVHQGAAQWAWFTGDPVTAEDLARLGGEPAAP